jgi:hypothetical protein
LMRVKAGRACGPLAAVSTSRSDFNASLDIIGATSLIDGLMYRPA